MQCNQIFKYWNSGSKKWRFLRLKKKMMFIFSLSDRIIFSAPHFLSSGPSPTPFPALSFPSAIRHETLRRHGGAQPPTTRPRSIEDCQFCQRETCLSSSGQSGQFCTRRSRRTRKCGLYRNFSKISRVWKKPWKDKADSRQISFHLNNESERT